MADNDSDFGYGALVIFAGLAIGIGGWVITGQSWVFLIGLAIGGIGWLMIERNDPGGHRRKAAEEAAFEHRLEADAGGFAAPLVLRQYDNTDDGNRLFQREGEIFMAHGYEPSGPSAEGGHIHAGRLLLTGGLSVLAGRKGIRSKGKITVTFQKRPVAEPAADVGGQLSPNPPIHHRPDRLSGHSNVIDADAASRAAVIGPRMAASGPASVARTDGGQAKASPSPVAGGG